MLSHTNASLFMDFQIAKFHKQVLNLAPKRKKKEKKRTSILSTNR